MSMLAGPLPARA